ncbi:hypothetical protein C1Y08_08145 [Pseudomonas sp. FW306-02-F02-AA]|nr:hypothetical protein C1Y07_13355 [Pseudomonas sp. FW306-02-F02-AB]PMZ09730.1 hypothetical protein C1Y06_12010 [Pseudomonas sp. FW306-02-H06C]PMZ16370.1 hypothetical protein C1Y08_08145 [Pseudomonas sp. FW306-02-F02-AA]PMZ22311.1 hypothetical protein C1Y09_08685 [Pseudomonas sp. FW306-02-F08-AA]PMZ27528.1 hypothetical protein C1Y05_12190 [Pseudomonas sp. FW306-02-F04-BA]PMZ34631.1 hypothetical protein C1X99_09905 [Pseudomonas sp. FW306-02-H06B]PMZ39585.1 hypothetical protein C1Y00_15435 [Ps
MNGQRAVFERRMLAQRPLLIRTPTRSKEHMNIPARSGAAGPLPSLIFGYQIGFGQSMKMCSRANRRAR